MPGFLKDRREAWLFCGACICFALLLLVKIKLSIPTWMAGPGWAKYVGFFQSNALEDIAGDLLAGLISAYFFYILIDLIPRRRNERRSLEILNLLVASIIQAYATRHFFAHTMALTQADVAILAKEKLDLFLKELNEKPDYAKLKCALFTAHSRLSDFRQTLSIASPLGPGRTLQWLVITDKVRLLVDEYENHPESEKYRPSQVFYADIEGIDEDHEAFIKYYSDMESFRDSLKFCFYEYLEEARKWIAPGDSKAEAPEPIDVDATVVPSSVSGT
jgi:hypothetical protein